MNNRPVGLEASRKKEKKRVQVDAMIERRVNIVEVLYSPFFSPWRLESEMVRSRFEQF